MTDSKAARSYIQKDRHGNDGYLENLGDIRFDFVEAFNWHTFDKKRAEPGLDTNKLYKELLEFKVNLPVNRSSSIFVRAVDSRLHLIRALITGPEGTPYANGCFLFDVHVRDYPAKAPEVQFLTTGKGKVRFNPNLYQCGKVCLSLLGTWDGPGWEANRSTLLQLLVSIQGLVLVPDPYFNEPGYAIGRNDEHHKIASQEYTRNIRKQTLDYAMDEFLSAAINPSGLKDYPEFADVVIKHFCERANAIEEQLHEWATEDMSIKPHVEKVRRSLRELVEKQDNCEKTR